jgi:hypothetical protein
MMWNKYNGSHVLQFKLLYDPFVSADHHDGELSHVPTNFNTEKTVHFNQYHILLVMFFTFLYNFNQCLFLLSLIALTSSRPHQKKNRRQGITNNNHIYNERK